VAASRLASALNASGVKAKLLVRDKQTERLWVIDLPKSWKNRFRFVWERFLIWIENKFSRNNLFAMSIANTGEDITRLRDFEKADVIHLHWVNQGMLSLNGIRKIVDSGKPVVWTMHDMWNMTGICHYAGDCDHFRTSECHDCPLLPGLKVLSPFSVKVFKQKKELYDHSRITFVACSEWLKNIGKSSELLRQMPLVNIPNAIDVHLFSPSDMTNARLKYHLPLDKKLLLFGSMKVTDARKGVNYLIEACRIFSERYPAQKDKLAILMLGGRADSVVGELPFPVFSVGFLSLEKEIAEVYNAADLYVTPSLEDNLPNTIMEAMSCGTACVGFDVGGIPEMIDHRQNGYVARYKSADDLAEGIYWSLFEAEPTDLSFNARRKVLQNYSEEVVANRYIELYKSKLRPAIQNSSKFY
jgi:glycosyltransferase involved in cell wall biosynthesis